MNKNKDFVMIRITRRSKNKLDKIKSKYGISIIGVLDRLVMNLTEKELIRIILNDLEEPVIESGEKSGEKKRDNKLQEISGETGETLENNIDIEVKGSKEKVNDNDKTSFPIKIKI